MVRAEPIEYRLGKARGLKQLMLKKPNCGTPLGLWSAWQLGLRLLRGDSGGAELQGEMWQLVGLRQLGSISALRYKSEADLSFPPRLGDPAHTDFKTQGKGSQTRTNSQTSGDAKVKTIELLIMLLPGLQEQYRSARSF